MAHPDWDGQVNPEQKPQLVTPYIAQGDFQRVWHKPIFGLLNSSSKWIPTNYAPLTFEFTIQNGDRWCDTNQRHVAAVAGGTGAHAARAPQLHRVRTGGRL